MIMWPTFTQIYDNSFKPMAEGQINVETAIREAESPLRIFMFKQMSNQTQYIDLFMGMSNMDRPETLEDVPTHIR